MFHYILVVKLNPTCDYADSLTDHAMSIASDYLSYSRADVMSLGYDQALVDLETVYDASDDLARFLADSKDTGWCGRLLEWSAA